MAKPELLAPAGSLESFHAAINAGADAVYLGLDVFNARLRAKNFTVKTLAYLVPYAHSRNVKIYVTLNTMLKQDELEPLIHILYQLEQIGVDALIVADPGLIELATKYFPKLNLHASTQMAIHNAAGLKTAERLGLKRAVLARELTVDEIRILKKSTTIELETFIHGALCYCISGVCLASSFLGGSSGNRGMCTQVCRRKFSAGKSAGYYFSPLDFSALDHIRFYKDTGIHCLKIEGRMKGPEYVHTVVHLYRNALDTNENSNNTETLDLARKKTSLFLDGIKQTGIIDTDSPGGTGLLIGTVLEKTETGCYIDSSIEPEKGDRIRIQPQDGFEGIAATVEQIKKADTSIEVILRSEVSCQRGDLVFLVSRKSTLNDLDTDKKIATQPVQFKSFFAQSKNVLRKYEPITKAGKARSELWIKVDNVDWFEHLASSPCQHLIFAGDKAEYSKLLSDEKIIQMWRSRLIPEPPPFIAQGDIKNWTDLLKQCASHGIHSFASANIGHFQLFPQKSMVVADNPIWVLNSVAQAKIRQLGASFFVYSTEDEYINMRKCVADSGIFCIYSHIPLFISRIPNEAPPGKLSDPHKNEFFTVQKDDLNYLISKKPLCLTKRVAKMQEAGIHHFLIDLSFVKPDSGILQEIIEGYKSDLQIQGTTLFNFKAGLR